MSMDEEETVWAGSMFHRGFAKFTLLDVESRHFVLRHHKCSDETGS